MEEAVLEKTVCAETKDRLECVLAAGIGGASVEKFGCSDCDCASHLFYRKEDPTKEVLSVFEKMGMHAVEHPILGSKK